MVLASDARHFKDELDILRNKCEKMVCFQFLFFLSKLTDFYFLKD